MDQELKQRLIGYLDALEKGATTGGEFVAEQAPEVCREIVNWRIADGLIIAAPLLAAICLIACVVRYVFVVTKDVDDSSGSKSGPRIMAVAVGLFLSTMMASFAVESIHRSAKAIFAPRLVILEEIRKHL